MNMPQSTTLTDALAEGLRSLGCRHAYGVAGAAIGRFTAAAWRAGLSVVHTRHEGGAGFMAAESSLAADGPEVVFVTSGPGLSNALTGLIAAAWEGAHVVAVVGGTARDRGGRFAFQQTGAAQLDLTRWLPPGLPHPVVDLRDVPLDGALATVAAATARPQGSLSMLLLPTDVQQQATSRTSAPPAQAPERLSPEAVASVAARLAGRRVACWVGHGARHAAEEVRALVEQLGAVVMVTPRGKGVVSESHPACLGVTGLGGARGVSARLAAAAPEVGLVLGCRLSEFSSWWDPSLIPPEGLILVGPAPSDAAYPGRAVMQLASEVGPFAAALRAEAPAAVRCGWPGAQAPEPIPAPGPGGMHPLALMAAIQEQVVERSDALLISEAGNAFAWATRALRMPAPRYRVSPDFGAMGHAAAGVVGMALARGGKAVALLGDGAMLMNTEINTAVAHRAPAVWVVLNDAGYGMIHHGMVAIGEPPIAGRIPRVDFVAFARAQGADGAAADDPASLREALAAAMAAEGPFVVDVRIDPEVPPPFGARNEDLTEQQKKEPTWRG